LQPRGKSLEVWACNRHLRQLFVRCGENILVSSKEQQIVNTHNNLVTKRVLDANSNHRRKEEKTHGTARSSMPYWTPMPPLIRFLLKWSLIGMAAGWAFAVLLLVTDVGGLGGMWWRAEQRALWLVVLAVSFGVSFAQVTVLRSDFGGKGDGGNDRLSRWKVGGSAELERDEPLT
jgi:hypothetical protein